MYKSISNKQIDRVFDLIKKKEYGQIKKWVNKFDGEGTGAGKHDYEIENKDGVTIIRGKNLRN